ncbi:three-helix bundle dimerization domain-containing protein [Dactylosporangium sp. NPDC006015]|uniref:three-helix bundle dimerization domain-containing protein n=1 Tax=Dactylosporangium sp. NPDC006015 TaxID=3154576 RepID=UPI0033A602CB
MTGHDGVAHLGDIDTALRREADILSERFPDAPRAEVDALVHEVYAELLRDAEVETHVLSLTRPRVIEQLRERGYDLHEPEAG